jgi:hypothetical protein
VLKEKYPGQVKKKIYFTMIPGAFNSKNNITEDIYSNAGDITKERGKRDKNSQPP